MIEAIPSELPKAKSDAIALWLNREEANDFISALKAEVAILTADAVRKTMSAYPHRLFAHPPTLHTDTEDKLHKAAMIQICLDVIDDKRQPSSTLHGVTLKLV